MSSSLLAGRTPKQFFSIGILLVSIAALTYLAITTRDYGPKFLKRRKGRTGKAANLKKKKVEDLVEYLAVQGKSLPDYECLGSN
ncbi:hypothetical protein MT418_005172 [Batrachochytrium dendrobatidis]